MAISETNIQVGVLNLAMQFFLPELLYCTIHNFLEHGKEIRQEKTN
jgi:hypothetical protein